MKINKKEIMERYNDLGGEIYDLRYTEEQSQKYNEVLSQIRILETDLILDHGCGTGLLMEQFNNIIVGIDLSIALLKTAREKTRLKRGAHLVQGDVGYLPFNNKVFKLTFQFTVLQNIPEPVEVLKEINRVSKGLKVISTLKKLYKKQELLKIFVTAGLKIEKIVNSKNTNDWLVFLG